MGSLTASARRSAAGAVVLAALVAAGVAALDGHAAVVAGALVGVALVAVGLLAGRGALVVLGTVALAAAAAAALVRSAPDGEVALGSLAVAVALWLAFELACSSLEHRPATTASPAVRRSRVADVAAIAAVGGLIGLLALAAAGQGPVGGPLLRAAAMGSVVVTVGLVWALSRARR